VSGRLRATWAEVDLAAIRHNVALLRPPGAALMAVVKANAYGHGDVGVARAALEAGASWLGVATVEEAIGLRSAGVEAPILVLSELPPGAEAIAIAHRITPVLYGEPGLERLAATARGSRIGVHVKVDTGMHRVGVWPPGDALGFARRALEAGLAIEGLWTHFASSEDDPETTKTQLERFVGVVDAFRDAGIDPGVVHASNSGATILHPEATFDLVRPGIAILGVPPAPGVGEALGLRPALSWRSVVTMAKRLPAGERLSYNQRYELETDAWVATVPVGYADGYPRAASSRADVLIGGVRHRVAGNVTMDQLLVDCGDHAVAPGDEVTLIGRQGSDEITAWQLAERADTIAYEVLTRISDRVAREVNG
jgi:alanine racemase